MDRSKIIKASNELVSLFHDRNRTDEDHDFLVKIKEAVTYEDHVDEIEDEDYLESAETEPIEPIRYLLVSNCNRDILVEAFKNADNAYDEMKRNYERILSQYSVGHKEYVEQKIPGGRFDFDIDRRGAWINDNVNDDYYDWLIIEVKI